MSETRRGPVQALQLGSVGNAERAENADSLNGRVMLIDGTSIIHRAYYKLLGMLFDVYNNLVTRDLNFFRCFFLSFIGFGECSMNHRLHYGLISF